MSRRVNIPNIETDDDLCVVIDELKHRIKAPLQLSPLQRAFNETLNVFIREHELDSDPHYYATLPSRGR